jgi:hypothetical protein
MGSFPLEGEEDADYINAEQTITTLGASFLILHLFGMIRSQK